MSKENELGMIMKCQRIKYNGVMMSGEEAFRKLVIESDLIGMVYTIDWSKNEINTY